MPRESSLWNGGAEVHSTERIESALSNRTPMCRPSRVSSLIKTRASRDLGRRRRLPQTENTHDTATYKPDSHYTASIHTVASPNIKHR